MLTRDRKLRKGNTWADSSLHLLRLGLFYFVWKWSSDKNLCNRPNKGLLVLRVLAICQAGATYGSRHLRKACKLSVAPGLKNLSHKVCPLPKGTPEEFLLFQGGAEPRQHACTVLRMVECYVAESCDQAQHGCGLVSKTVKELLFWDLILGRGKFLPM